MSHVAEVGEEFHCLVAVWFRKKPFHHDACIDNVQHEGLSGFSIFTN